MRLDGIYQISMIDWRKESSCKLPTVCKDCSPANVEFLKCEHNVTSMLNPFFSVDEFYEDAAV